MMRRYNRWWARFDQPDPYDGSYDATNPQSFNRYAYVNNDPVNFVDPSGLNLEEPDHRWSATDGVSSMGFMGPGIHGSNASGWYSSVEGPSFYATVYYSMTFFFGAGGTLGGTTGLSGGGTPQEPSKPSFEKPTDRRTECQKFADMVQQMANNASSRRGFLDSLASTFTAATNSRFGEMRRTANTGLPAGRPTFGDGGFQRQFQDGSNQVRHSVGGFIAGANIGWIPARYVMNDREQRGRDDADIAVNGVSTYLGATTIGHGIGYIRNNIANEIRSRLCQ